MLSENEVFDRTATFKSWTQTLRRGSHGVLSYDVTGAKAGTRRKEGALSGVKSF